MEIDMMLIVLGSNIASPKEVYRIYFHKSTQQQISEKAKDNLVRTVIRSIATSGYDVINSELAPTKIHLLVRSKRQNTTSNHVVPKQNYKLKLPRSGGIFDIHFGDDRDDSQHDEQDLIWFQVQPTLQGFLLSSQSNQDDAFDTDL
eukprot:TRINITY_DN6693_c0_g1_i2.p1 TRINITY_DN6693_c0_g1~~TRINITY_DN6693_c0_g1_i2.p1  ORF type:complete len:146 (+),score=43.53 TRINITY_DN6693_c0_g1_i2:293-730(+)